MIVGFTIFATIFAVYVIWVISQESKSCRSKETKIIKTVQKIKENKEYNENRFSKIREKPNLSNDKPLKDMKRISTPKTDNLLVDAYKNIENMKRTTLSEINSTDSFIKNDLFQLKAI